MRKRIVRPNEASPIKRFFWYMTERENIRKNKLAGKSWPWTKDEILQKYKFTNVKREHDRTSQLFLNEIYTPNFNATREQILLNCAIARYFGTIEFMRELGWQKDFHPRYIKSTAVALRKEDKRVYTGAYIIPSGGRYGPKIDFIVNVMLKGLWENMDKLTKNWEDWEDFHNELYKRDGFGGSGFIAKEVALDTMFFKNFWPSPPKDITFWTHVGPGSKRGAAYILNRPGESLNTAKTLEVIKSLWGWHQKYLPDGFVPLILHDIQFSLCEFSKYERTRLGLGRPKAMYHMYTETHQLELDL